jgi:hypothetical protein
MAFDSSSIYASDHINYSKEAYRDTHGITAVDLISWEGLYEFSAQRANVCKRLCID